MQICCLRHADEQIRRAHIVLIAASYSLLAVISPLGAQQVTKMDAPTAHEKALKGELLLVDIRTPEAWKHPGVPASAQALTMHQDGPVFVSSLLWAAGGDSKLPVAVICRTGSRSTALAGPLSKAGFPNVINVVEGVVGGARGTGWIKRELPLRTWTPEQSAPQLAQDEK